MQESFEQVLALGRHDIEQLLEHGRPEQRVWAIWALALCAGEPALGIATRVDREPDPGVRRTLAVMLAGRGDTDLLVALARHDPALVVRETSIQLATRLAAGGALDPAIVHEACTREPAIRIAMLGAIGPGAPAFLVEIALRQLAAGPADVKLEAFEALLRVATPEARAPAQAWMLAQRDVAHACDRWLRAAGVDSLAQAFAGAGRSQRASVLQRLRSPPWRAVELLIADDRDLLRSVLLRDDIEVPARMLARAIMQGMHEVAEQLTSQLAAASVGRELAADLRAAIERDHVGLRLRGLADRVRRYATALEVPDGAVVLDELAAAHPVEQLLGLEHAVARWLAEAPADLVPVIPELHRYCTRRLAELDVTRRGLDPRRALAEGEGDAAGAAGAGDGGNPAEADDWNEARDEAWDEAWDEDDEGADEEYAWWDEQTRLRDLVAALAPLLRP